MFQPTFSSGRIARAAALSLGLACGAGLLTCSDANRVQGAVAGTELKAVKAALGFVAEDLYNGQAASVVVLADYEKMDCQSGLDELQYVTPIRVLILVVAGFGANLNRTYTIVTPDAEWSNFQVGGAISAFLFQGIDAQGAPTAMQRYFGTDGEVAITSSSIHKLKGTIDGTFSSTFTQGALQGDFSIELCGQEDPLSDYLLALLCPGEFPACLQAD